MLPFLTVNLCGKLQVRLRRWTLSLSFSFATAWVTLKTNSRTQLNKNTNTNTHAVAKTTSESKVRRLLFSWQYLNKPQKGKGSESSPQHKCRQHFSPRMKEVPLLFFLIRRCEAKTKIEKWVLQKIIRISQFHSRCEIYDGSVESFIVFPANPNQRGFVEPERQDWLLH